MKGASAVMLACCAVGAAAMATHGPGSVSFTLDVPMPQVGGDKLKTYAAVAELASTTEASFAKALDLEPSALSVVSNLDLNKHHRRLQGSLTFTYTIRCQVNGCQSETKKYDAFSKDAAKRTAIATDISTATGTTVAAPALVDLSSSKFLIGKLSAGAHSIPCDEVVNMAPGAGNAGCLGEGAGDDSSRPHANSDVFYQCTEEDKKANICQWTWQTAPENLLNSGDVYMKAQKSAAGLGASGCAAGGGFFGSTTVDTTITLGCFSDRGIETNQKCTPSAMAPKVGTYTTSAIGGETKLAVKNSVSKNTASVYFYEFHLPKDTTQTICCGGGCQSTGVFVRQQSSIVHCEVSVIKISRPGSGGPWQMFLSEIEVYDLSGSKVSMTGTSAVGAGTTIASNTAATSCTSASGNANFAGSLCYGDSASILNDGDSNSLHGVWFHNNAGADYVTLTLAQPTKISKISVMGGGGGLKADGLKPGSAKYQLDLFADDAMLRKVGGVETGTLPMTTDGTFNKCFGGN